MKSSMLFENRSKKKLILFSIANNKKPKIEPKISIDNQTSFFEEVLLEIIGTIASELPSPKTKVSIPDIAKI